MDERSRLDHFARGCLQIVTHMIGQYPRHALARVDKSKFLDAFSSVIDGVRVVAAPWDLGPGWVGDDTCIGKRYIDDITSLDEHQLQKAQNSDDNRRSDIPFGNISAKAVHEEWRAHTKNWTTTIPLCMASDFSGLKELEPNPNLRRSESIVT
jgi:hypothetical protein